MQPILSVDLTSGKLETITVPEEWKRDYLGGASLAARLLFEHLVPELDPLSPQAPLLFMNGPLSGTAGPAVGRFVICGRSPASGLWGESNCGGFWGPELRMAGYDGLLVTGKAEKAVYLSILDGHVELKSAGHLWGLDTYETQAAIRKELASSTARVACIGQAGETGIPFALIMCDHGRVAGRTGMGAVMGSKNLKAVAVKGSGKVPLFNSSTYAMLRAESNRDLRSDSVSEVLRELGTASIADYYDYLMEMPKRYFQRGTYPEDMKISGSNLAETLLAGVSACHACVIACGRVVKLEDNVKRKGPEYETLVGFGPNLGLNDPVLATRFGELCDRYGMDSISLSGTLGLAFALYERGIITQVNTDGLALEWGNAQAVEALIHKTARREGVGAYLAKGAYGLGQHFGAADQAVQVNGLEVAYHDPRGASGMALVYATSPRGACHNQSDYFLVEIGQVETSLGLQYYPPKAGAEKAANVARHQNWRTVFNSLVMCILSNVPPEMVLSLINSACGLDWTIDEMMLAGERGWNLKRIINNRLGLTHQNDRLPKALLIPFEDDPDGYVPDLDTMLEAYYAARGWDPETGFPTREKMEGLGLVWVREELDL